MKSFALISVLTFASTFFSSSAAAWTLQNLEVTKAQASTCTAPPAAMTFANSDSNVYLYFVVQGMKSGDQAVAHWLNPRNSWVWTTTWNKQTSAGNFCFPNGYLPNSQFASSPGYWWVEIYVNNQYQGHSQFNVLSPPPPSRTMTFTNVGGWISPPGISDGKWTGQPDRAVDANGKWIPGSYLNYYAADYYAETGSFWTIKGTGFGKPGTVRSSDANIIIDDQKTAANWTDIQIRVYIHSTQNFTYNSAVTLTITASDSVQGKKTIPVLSTIKGGGRGYGQCTWYVAYRRLNLSPQRSIPGGSYDQTLIAANYIPQQWDILDFGTLHSSIISSIVTTALNKDGSTTYSFTISEMNAYPAWREKESSAPPSQFTVKLKNGIKNIVPPAGLSGSGIISRYSRNSTATGYFR